MVALEELRDLARRQDIAGPADPERLADAATVFLCAEYYLTGWLEAAQEESGSMVLRDAVSSLQAMRDDLLSLRYDPEWLEPDEAVRVAAAQKTLLHAMRVLEEARS